MNMKRTIATALAAMLAAQVAARAQGSTTPAKPAPAVAPTAPAALPVQPASPPAVTVEKAAISSTPEKSVAAPASQGRGSRDRGPKPGSGTSSTGSKSSSNKSGSPADKSGAAVALKGFDAFRPIADKNIFNPNRYSRPKQEEERRPPPKVESFALVGTMSFEKGSFAFFESDNSAYRKTAKPGDDIAGHKLKEVGPSEVKLTKDEKETELKVGDQLKREDDGPWLASMRPLPEEPYRSPYLSSGGGSSSGGGFGGGDLSDIIRRMMEARMQGSGGFDRSRFGGSSFDRGGFDRSRFGGGGSDRGSDPRRGGGSSESPAESAQRRIREQDRDNDGRVSLQEADRGLRDRFREIDRNGDGFVDSSEYTAYYTERMSGGPSGGNSLGSAGGVTSSPSIPAPVPRVDTTPPANADDILKRLMEQRQKENNK